MSVIVLVVGILVTVAGLVAIGFGIRSDEFSLGQTLIIAGTTGFAGGLVLTGLAAAVSMLARIAEVLSVRPAARPPGQEQRSEGFAPEPRAVEVRPSEPSLAEPRPIEARSAAQRPAELRPIEPRPEARPAEPRPTEARPAADATVDVSASAIERLRSSIARPPKPEMVAEAEDVPLDPGVPPPMSAQNGNGREASGPVDASARNSGSTADTSKGKRLDFLFRSRVTRPEPAEPQGPQRSARELLNGPQAEPAPRPAKAEQPVADEAPQTDGMRAPPGPVPPQWPQEPQSVAILKSGVVDGMAYTLYADGSIEAQLPQGTVRFGSITELRSHIENNS
jgi:hypothetical protein